MPTPATVTTWPHGRSRAACITGHHSGQDVRALAQPPAVEEERLVSSQEDAPGAAVSLSKTRLEAFSDGVFSIATTLLVLDIALHPPGSPLKQVLEAWPYYLAYLVSFLTIGGAWLAHTALTDRLARADAILLRLNLLVLLGVGFLPFPTRLVAEAIHDVNGERVFVTMYGLTLLAIRIFGFALDEYARREHLYDPGRAKNPSNPGEAIWRSWSCMWSRSSSVSRCPRRRRVLLRHRHLSGRAIPRDQTPVVPPRVGLCAVDQGRVLGGMR